MEDFASRSHGCARTIFTIGHSTRTFAELIALLREARIELLVDVRSVPRSRTNPRFNIDILPEALAAAGVGYRHLPSLGGWRHHRKNAMPSPNTLWRNASFRNYADYAGIEAFRDRQALWRSRQPRNPRKYEVAQSYLKDVAVALGETRSPLLRYVTSFPQRNIAKPRKLVLTLPETGAAPCWPNR
jgi:hypothetical protein